MPCVRAQSKDSCRIVKGSEVCHESETVERGKQATGKAGRHSFVGARMAHKQWGLYSQGVGMRGRDRSSEGHERLRVLCDWVRREGCTDSWSYWDLWCSQGARFA